MTFPSNLRFFIPHRHFFVLFSPKSSARTISDRCPSNLDITYKSFLVIKNPEAVLSKKSEALFSVKAHFLAVSKGVEYNYVSIPDTAKSSHSD